MKLVHPKHLTAEQSGTLKLCLESSSFEPSRKEVIDSIAEGLGSIESGVHLLDRELPVPSLGIVDILAKDSANRLLLIDYCDKDLDSIYRMMAKSGWIRQNRGMITHFYGELAAELRLWAFTETVTNEMNLFLSGIGPTAPEIFKHRALALGDEKWIVIRRHSREGGNPNLCHPHPPNGTAPEGTVPVFGGLSPLSSPFVTTKNNINSRESLHFRSFLSSDEIDDFFKDSGKEQEDDDITTSCPLI